MMNKELKKWLLIVTLSFAIAVCFDGIAHGQSRITIRGDDWLRIADISGQVELITGNGERRRRARLGDILQNVGDTLITGPESSARLDVTSGAGFCSVAENSQMHVQTLAVSQDRGRVTAISVVRGQVRLRIRRLTNPSTRIEIYTPAGVLGTGS